MILVILHSIRHLYIVGLGTRCSQECNGAGSAVGPGTRWGWERSRAWNVVGPGRCCGRRCAMGPPFIIAIHKNEDLNMYMYIYSYYIDIAYRPGLSLDHLSTLDPTFPPTFTLLSPTHRMPTPYY